MWYVCFLQLSNGDIYVGFTNDLKRRFSSHQSGQVLSTREHLSTHLKSCIAVETEACSMFGEDHGVDMVPSSGIARHAPRDVVAGAHVVAIYYRNLPWRCRVVEDLRLRDQ